MTIQIDTNNGILIDGQYIGLNLAQTFSKTLIYKPENTIAGTKYQVYTMPLYRYSASHDTPKKPGGVYDPKVTAGRIQLEADVRALMTRLV